MLYLWKKLENESLFRFIETDFKMYKLVHHAYGNSLQNQENTIISLFIGNLRNGAENNIFKLKYHTTLA